MKSFHFTLIALTIMLGLTPATSFAFKEVPMHQTASENGTLSITNNEHFTTTYRITSSSNKNTREGELSPGETVTLSPLHMSFPQGGIIVIYKNADKPPYSPYYREGEINLYPAHPFKWVISKKTMKLGGHIYTKEAYLPID